MTKEAEMLANELEAIAKRRARYEAGNTPHSDGAGSDLLFRAAEALRALATPAEEPR